MDIKTGVMYKVLGSSNLDSVGLLEDQGPDLVMRVDYLKGGSYLYWPVAKDEFIGLFDGSASVGSNVRVLISGKSYKKME